MSAAKIILDRLLPAAAPWTPDDRGMYVLTVLPDVIVNIAEDASGAQVHFFSPVGYGQAGEAIRAGLADDPQAREDGRVVMSAETGLVVTLRSLDRMGLDDLEFARHLGCHVRFSRAVAAALPPLAQDSIHLPAPGSQTTWVECALA